jgi:hypothetical protein
MHNYSDLRMLPSLRSFLATIRASFWLDTTYVVTTQPKGDQYSMDIAHESHMFKEDDLADPNYCRLYLEATTISDITSPDGIYLAPNLSFGDTPLPSKDRIHRARQQRPQTLFWTYWLRFLRLISDRRGKLQQPLGHWQYPGSQPRRTWPMYYDQKLHRIFRRTSTGYIHYEVFETRCLSGIPVTWTPTDRSVPVALEETSKDCWSLTAPKPHTTLPTANPRQKHSKRTFTASHNGNKTCLATCGFMCHPWELYGVLATNRTQRLRL